ncbi:MAG TPA: hypothetical protein VIZ90_16245 [Rhizobiaceae bacterium]
MPQRHIKPEHVHVGRAGWFAMGALAASMAFVALLVAGDFFKAASSENPVSAEPPPLVIEGN